MFFDEIEIKQVAYAPAFAVQAGQVIGYQCCYIGIS
jgi:hypothetical protein